MKNKYFFKKLNAALVFVVSGTLLSSLVPSVSQAMDSDTAKSLKRFSFQTRQVQPNSLDQNLDQYPRWKINEELFQAIKKFSHGGNQTKIFEFFGYIPHRESLENLRICKSIDKYIETHLGVKKNQGWRPFYKSTSEFFVLKEAESPSPYSL